MGWYITNPQLAKAGQVRVRQYYAGGAKVTEADMGEMAQYVCISEHGPGAVRPPKGFGDIAGKAPPHVHSEDGAHILEDKWWVVVFEGEVLVYDDISFRERFMPVQFNEPPYEVVKGRVGYYGLPVQGLKEEHATPTEDRPSLPERL